MNSQALMVIVSLELPNISGLILFGNQMMVLEVSQSWKRTVHFSLPISILFVPSNSTGILRRCVN